MESDHKNRETVVLHITYQNVNPDLYQNWLRRKKNKDYRYNFENEEIWLFTQLIDRNNEKENNVVIGENGISDNNHSLFTIH